MKTNKYKLSALAMGVALALGSLSASAVPVATHPSAAAFDSAISAEQKGPNVNLGAHFDISDRGGLCLVESVLSLIAATEHVKPGCVAKNYRLDVTAGLDGYGEAALSGFSTDTFLTGEVNYVDKLRGAKCSIEGDDYNRINGITLKRYYGKHAWSRTNAIFLDSAKFKLNGVDYDEHSIKDYFGRVVRADDINNRQFVGHTFAFDWGLEAITKLDYPMTKWAERSWYRKFNGVDGLIKVSKSLVSSSCHIQYDADGVNNELGFDFSGIVRVGPKKFN